MHFSPLSLIPLALRYVAAEVGAAFDLQPRARHTTHTDVPRQTAATVSEQPKSTHIEQIAAVTAPQGSSVSGGSAANPETMKLPIVAAVRTATPAAPTDLSPELVAEIDSATGSALFTAAEVEELIRAAQAPARTVQVPAEVLPEMCCTMTLAKLTVVHPAKKAQLMGTFVSAFLYEGGCDDEECKACPPGADESENAVVIQYVPETGDRSIRTIELDPEVTVQLAL